MNLYLAESGGVWNAYFKNGSDADENLLCQAQSPIKRSGMGGEIFKGTNILQSFYYCDRFTVESILPQCKSFMLDSGAFTFFGSGKQVDWDEYLRKYAQFINEHQIKLFFELDIDQLVGYERVLYFRKRLEDMTGKASIPVWHKSRGREDYLKTCEEYDYVAIGGIVTKEITQKEYNVFPYLISEAHKRDAKVHGLGFTNLKGLTMYHFDSVDSTAWISGNRFGCVYRFDGKTMQKHDKRPGQRLANAKDVALHNFREWVKFQKYAEVYL